MEISVQKLKKYNSTYNYVIFVNSKPICITESTNRANSIISYLGGGDVIINDGCIKSMLDKLKKSQKKQQLQIGSVGK